MKTINLLNLFNFYLQLAEVQLIAVSHWGIHLVKKEAGNLRVVASISLGDIGSCTAPRPSTVTIEGPQGRVTLHTPRAIHLSEMVTKFCTEFRRVSNVFIVLILLHFYRNINKIYGNYFKNNVMTF